MNKEQIKHWTGVLSQFATAQFLFIGGKSMLTSALNGEEVNWLALACSVLIYAIMHLMIHIILSVLED